MSIRRPLLLLSLTTSNTTSNPPQQSPLLLAKLTSQSQTNHTFKQFSTMTTTPKPGSDSFFRVPGVDQGELDGIFDQTFLRYSLTSSPQSSSTSNAQRTGNGVAIMWFRNDLRVLDNLALFTAWQSSLTVLPVYCIDPRLFSSTTYHFGFPKTGALRAQFFIQSLVDLRNNLRKCGLDLLVQHGKPEEILPSLAKAFGAHTVYAQKETCSEEVNVERRLHKSLQHVVLPVPAVPNQPSTPKKSRNPSLQLVWGSTLYHIDDLPFGTSHLPDVYTQFRKLVESKCRVRGCIKMPKSLGPPPQIEDWGNIPSTEELGIRGEKASKGCVFLGGESAALGRIHEYFWNKDLLKSYKETRNGMLGSDYSTKLSPWLASGSLSPRLIYEEVKRYEKARIANDSTYWVLFELIWRDYFRFLSIKYGNSIFHLGGPRKVKNKWSQDTTLFEAWRGGKTGYPLIDANMRELASTGFMSNRGRQIVCSFLVRDMGIDWRMGAEWFETCLLDYDPCSNYGNWTYGAGSNSLLVLRHPFVLFGIRILLGIWRRVGHLLTRVSLLLKLEYAIAFHSFFLLFLFAGVGNDPREDRYFSIPKQAQVYDPDGDYVAYWLPELRQLPKPNRHSPGTTKYISPIVPLKFGNTGRPVNPKTTSSMRQSNFRRR